MTAEIRQISASGSLLAHAGCLATAPGKEPGADVRLFEGFVEVVGFR
jgi:hypothetical protein